MKHVEQLHEDGYTIVRGFLPPEDVCELVATLDRVHAEALKHHAS